MAQRVILTLLLCVFIGNLNAEVFEGRWILNVSKSSGTVPKEETVIIQQRDDLLDVSISIVIADAAKPALVIKYSAPIKGGAAHVAEGPYSGVTLTRLNANTLETTYFAEGAPLRSTVAVVSQDGKSMTSTGKAVGRGDQSSWIMCFDKQ